MWAKKLVRRYTGRDDYEFGDITKATLQRVGSAVDWVANKAGSALATDSNPTSSVRGVRESRRNVQEPYPPQSRQSPSSRDSSRKNRPRRSLIDEHLTSGPVESSVQPSAPVAEDEANALASAPTLLELSFPPDDHEPVSAVPDDCTSVAVSKATGTVDIELIWDTLLNRALFLGQQYLKSGLLTRDDFLSCEAFLYLGLPAVTLFEAASRSVGYRGVVLAAGLEIDEAACPQGHQTIYGALTSIRDKLRELTLSNLEFAIIRQTLLFNSDPTKEIPDRDSLDERRRKEINQLVAQVNSIASIVSQMAFFKEHFNGIMERLARY